MGDWFTIVCFKVYFCLAFDFLSLILAVIILAHLRRSFKYNIQKWIC